MATIKTPGVYIEETSPLPFSIAGDETAMPVFIGYTQKTTYDGIKLLRKATQVFSLMEFEMKFGKAKPQHLTVSVRTDGRLDADVKINPVLFNLYYALQLYFENGGGPCYIISIGKFPSSPDESKINAEHRSGIRSLASEPKPTIVVMPDASLAGEDQFYQLFQVALQRAALLPNRFVLVDIFSKNGKEKFADLATNFLTKIGNHDLKNGAAYYPYLQTVFTPYVDEQKEKIIVGRISFTLRQPDDAPAMALRMSLYHVNRPLYDSIKNAMNKINIVLPPSPAVAGVYCRMDREQGVWKAPANVSLSGVYGPTINISDKEQDEMNVDPVAGKSVNAIRTFSGKGTLVWGARTLAGNDNEWRYIPVRRFCGWVEASISTALKQFVFEPNDANTWSRVQSMIENFLITTWRNGALQGTKPNDAFYVKVGLGSTMTQADIQQGRLIIHVGIAPLKPAEFIILRLQQIMAK